MMDVIPDAIFSFKLWSKCKLRPLARVVDILDFGSPFSSLRVAGVHPSGALETDQTLGEFFRYVGNAALLVETNMVQLLVSSSMFVSISLK